MLIYTKTGDSGYTSLFSGGRVLKSDIRISAYGTIDELSSFIGLLRCNEIPQRDKNMLISIQKELINISSELAVKKGNKFVIDKILENKIRKLEKEIDFINIDLQPLKEFILSGSNKINSICHICRTVCRRAERFVVKLSEEEKINPLLLKYLNRLSDYFFVLARQFA